MVRMKSDDISDVIDSDIGLHIVAIHVGEGHIEKYVGLLRFLKEQKIPHLREPSDECIIDSSIHICVNEKRLRLLCDYLNQNNTDIRCLHFPIKNEMAFITFETNKQIMELFNIVKKDSNHIWTIEKIRNNNLRFSYETTNPRKAQDIINNKGYIE
jgi:hypothetical protein